MTESNDTPESVEASSGAAAPSDPAARRAGSDGAPSPAPDGSEPDPKSSPFASEGGELESEAAVLDGEPVEVDLAALAEKAAKADEYLDLAQRTRAEFENFRKRAAREAAAAQERGAVKLALELLPALDNLDRALAHAETGEANGDGSFVSGVKHVHSELIAGLKRADITPFSPEGEPFDPQFHEAVAQQPVEGAEPGTVVEVYQRGYRRGDSVLRPARVVVAG